MNTKKYLERFASVSIFESLSNPLGMDIKPFTLYLSKRKIIESRGRWYEAIIPHFDGEVEEVYSYFFNIAYLPTLKSFDMQAAPTGTSYVYTWKEPQRDYLMRNSVFYYGHVTYHFNKVCSLFLEENWKGMYTLLKSYFKKEFSPDQLLNYFPNSPSCKLFEEGFYTEEGTEDCFCSNIKEKVDAMLDYGTQRRPHTDIKFARCIGLTQFELSTIKDCMLKIKVKVDKYLLMMMYAMNELNILPEEVAVQHGFKIVEKEQCRSQQEEEVCSTSQGDCLSGQQ